MTKEEGKECMKYFVEKYFSDNPHLKEVGLSFVTDPEKWPSARWLSGEMANAGKALEEKDKELAKDFFFYFG